MIQKVLLNTSKAHKFPSFIVLLRKDEKQKRQNNNIFLAFHRSGKILKYDGSMACHIVYMLYRKDNKKWYLQYEQKSIKSKGAYNKSPTRRKIYELQKTMVIVQSRRNWILFHLSRILLEISWSLSFFKSIIYITEPTKTYNFGTCLFMVCIQIKKSRNCLILRIVKHYKWMLLLTSIYNTNNWK